MKKAVIFVTLVTIMVYFSAVSLGYAGALRDGAAESVRVKAGNMVLAKGTSISVELTEELSSKKNKQGDTVCFQLTNDVLVEDVIVIPAKTQVKGVVTKIKRAGRRDKDGQIEITLENVEAPGGACIPVHGKIQELGCKQNILIKFSLAGFLIKGKEARIPQGTECILTVAEDTRLEAKAEGL